MEVTFYEFYMFVAFPEELGFHDSWVWAFKFWREAKMKECFDEISHRSGVINLAAYKEAS